jgi:integrase
MEAFRGWIAQQRILGVRAFRDTSVETYTAMFSTWLEWLKTCKLSVVGAAPGDATRFFEQKGLEPLSRRRYLQLLDRVYRHLRQCGRPGPSPIQEELSKERELERSLPPSLTDEQVGKLRSYLQAQTGWKGARDRALASLLVGAGLRANEVAQLLLPDVAPDYVVYVRPKTVHRAHNSLIVPDGPWRTWYDTWLVERAAKNIPGQVVIPTTPKGEGFDPSGLFRRINCWFTAAGIVAEQSGPNILRSTFGRLALTCGRYTPAEVQEFLGHQDERYTERHRPSSDGAAAAP